MVLKVVTSTLQRYFLPKSSRNFWFTSVTQLNTLSVALRSGGKPFLIGLLAAKIGQVTGLVGRGSGICVCPAAPVEPEPQAASRLPKLPAAKPAPAVLVRKPRRLSAGRGGGGPPVSPANRPGGGGPSAVQPSRGCIGPPAFRQWTSSKFS